MKTLPDKTWTRVAAQQAAVFARDTLLSPSRKVPVVALTTPADLGHPWLDPEALAAELAGRARVVVLETGATTMALSAALPPRCDVYGGAARIWWPGLKADSDPLDHVLMLIHDEREAAQARERILAAILGGDPAAGRWGSWRPRGDRSAKPGAALRKALPAPAAEPPQPDPWQRIAEEYRVGDVVPARVFRLDPGYVLVELLPGAGVLVPLAEIDYTWVRDPAELLVAGEKVNVRLLELEPEARRGVASIKRALGLTAREGIGLRLNDPPYLAAASVEESDGELRRALLKEREVLRRQYAALAEAVEGRQRLSEQLEEAKQQAAAARKELRGAEQRVQNLEERIAGELDPLASETSFLAAVRVEHARRFDEDDRQRYPLARMRVGREFLARLRQLDGIDVAKVVEVCAQVASGRAHEIPGRAVHELTAGATGPSQLRTSDGARAWRCALQINTPSARRLHWWAIPGKPATLEFASVAVHDDFSIPE